jgi:hypothetical protein
MMLLENIFKAGPIFEWHSHFKACLVSAEDDKRSGRPFGRKTTENVKRI